MLKIVMRRDARAWWTTRSRLDPTCGSWASAAEDATLFVNDAQARAVADLHNGTVQLLAVVNLAPIGRPISDAELAEILSRNE